MERTHKEEFIKLYERVRHNPVFFLDFFYNKLSDEILVLTDEEKQELFDSYRAVPVLNNDTYRAYQDRLEKLRSQGKKDWEIF